MEKILFTLGTSNRTRDEFIALLRSHGIEIVIDVRSFPQSRFPQFNREAVSQWLGEEAVGYFYLGRELGGFRKGGYEAYTQTHDYLRGIDLLERMASRCRCAILCAERLPSRCHRRFIGQSMGERGWQIVDLIEN